MNSLHSCSGEAPTDHNKATPGLNKIVLSALHPGIIAGTEM